MLCTNDVNENKTIHYKLLVCFYPINPSKCLLNFSSCFYNKKCHFLRKINKLPSYLTTSQTMGQETANQLFLGIAKDSMDHYIDQCPSH